jgi:hypothetical protein
MKFFEFTQNNSGGSFDCDEYVAHRVLIEAENADEAILKGESLGMYWDGCESGMDCDCCGDRWYKPWGRGEKEFPYKYSPNNTFQTPEDYMQYMADIYGWTKPDGYIYYKNGNKVSIFSTKIK